MATYLVPSNSVLTEIAQEKAPTLTMDDPIFREFPIENVMAHFVAWEQEDNYVGLQQVRGLDGAPSRVTKTGSKQYVMEPGAYGEFEQISEYELTTARALGTYNQPIDLGPSVMKRQDKLMSREIDRIRQILWTLITTGTFSVSNANGTVVHTDSFNIQTFTASVAWSTYATATPLNDFRAIQLLSRGKGVRFDSTATAYMNRVTFNNMIKNSNSADIAGRRTSGLNTLLALNIAEFNSVLLGEDLPQIVINDDGYFNDAGTFVPFIADAKVAVIGRRTDRQSIGGYQKTINANNPNLEPGSYTKVVDKGEETVPRLIEVHQGHNGGPVLRYPSAIVMMNV